MFFSLIFANFIAALSSWQYHSNRRQGYLDITDRKHAEDALRESEEKYRGLFENLHELVVLRRFVYNEKGEVIDRVVINANPAALKAMGVLSIDEIMGRRGPRVLQNEVVGRSARSGGTAEGHRRAHHRGGALLR